MGMCVYNHRNDIEDEEGKRVMTVCVSEGTPTHRERVRPRTCFEERNRKDGECKKRRCHYIHVHLKRETTDVLREYERVVLNTQ